MCGAFFSMRALSWADTSLCRMACLISCTASPSARPVPASPGGDAPDSVNVVGQGFERRDVKAVDAVFQLGFCRHGQQLIDDGDEGGEGLSRSGGRADEHVPALLDERHGLPLRG